MKTLNRNHITVYYAQQTKVTNATDAYGHYTGEPTLTYDAPVAYDRFSYGPRKGTIALERFGLSELYVQPLVTDDMSCPVTVDTRLWIKAPATDGNGNILPHTHVVKAMIPTINSITYLCEEVSVL